MTPSPNFSRPDRSVWWCTIQTCLVGCKPMATKAPATERRSARERLLAAAEELFYGEGINTVGIDRIIERAGVAKASLYSNFKSKDELVRAYLVVRHESRKAQIQAKLAGLT